MYGIFFFQTFLSNFFFQIVIQMRWHLSVTHQSFIRTHFSLALSTLVQMGLIPPLAPSRCGQSEPTSRTWLGVMRTNIFPREVVWGQEVSPELMDALYHTQRRARLRVAPSRDPQHPKAGNDCVLTAASGSLLMQPCLKPDLPWAYQLLQPIVFVCAAELQPQD